ncbi:MAG: hypothetical protein HY938_09410 [Nitrosomonadales bacterium]|nr:hypothetical protein [Nitrosomonadales bacterium]
MKAKTLSIAEFEYKILATLTSVGSQTASKIQNLAMHLKKEDGFLPYEVAESIAWRVYVAKSLTLVSEDFVTHFRQALIELKHESLDMIFQTNPPPSLNINVQEAHRILRRCISLDEEYTFGNHQMLNDIFLHLNDNNVHHIIEFCKRYPEETTDLLMIASDVASFLATLESSQILRDIVSRRFTNILNAYGKIYGFNVFNVVEEAVQAKVDDNNLTL